MKNFQIRPRFQIKSNLNPDEITSRIIENLQIYQQTINGDIIPGFIILRLNRELQKYWSPELHLQLEEKKSGTLILGLFGPRPSVWTMFIAFKALTIFFALSGAVFGFSQWQTGNKPTGLIFMCLATALFFTTYVIALIGQKFSHKQIYILRDFLNKSLN